VQTVLGKSWRVFFLMGADSWTELKTWHEWQRLLGLCTPIVVTRPGHDLSADSVMNETVVRDVRGLTAARIAAQLETDELRQTFITDGAVTDVSATAIRAAIHHGDTEGWRAMVPQSVAEYIEKHHLYRN
jgi:nicotinate-nucleotide adenylyltransferase